jgi:hypothetical protein
MKHKQSKSYTTQSLKGGRDYMPTKKERQKKDLITQSISRTSNRFDMTHAQAWKYGSNIRESFKAEPKMVHITLMAMLKDAVEYLDFNKSFRHEGDYIEAIDYLIKEFPVMKIEEWKIICIRLKAGKYGKMYERLKLPELIEIFQQFEGERAEMREKQMRRNKDIPPPIDIELLKRVSKDLALPEPDTDEKGRWDFIPHPNTPE